MSQLLRVVSVNTAVVDDIKAVIKEKYVVVELPEYVDRLAKDFTVNVTAEYNEVDDVDETFIQTRVTAIKQNTFRIYASAPCTVNWLVFGTRRDASIEVEVPKNSTDVKGDGPYTWI